jgi:hypothetical protein
MSMKMFLAAIAASGAAAYLVSRLNLALPKKAGKKSGAGGGGGGAPKNQAFVFIKPHANTAATRALVKKTFAAKGVKVVSEGEISGEKIDKAGRLITIKQRHIAL